MAGLNDWTGPQLCGGRVPDLAWLPEGGRCRSFSAGSTTPVRLSMTTPADGRNGWMDGWTTKPCCLMYRRPHRRRRKAHPRTVYRGGAIGKRSRGGDIALFHGGPRVLSLFETKDPSRPDWRSSGRVNRGGVDRGIERPARRIAAIYDRTERASGYWTGR